MIDVALDKSNNEFIKSTRLGKRMSQGNLLIEPFNKVFNKARSLRMSIRLPGRRMSQIDQRITTDDVNYLESSKDEKPNVDVCDNDKDINVFKNGINSRVSSTTFSSRTPLKFTKVNNMLKKIAENSGSFESKCDNEKEDTLSNDRKYSSESITLTQKLEVITDIKDGETNDLIPSLHRISSNIPMDNLIRCSHHQNELHSGVTTDCDSEFTKKMEKEDKSLEDFNKIINQNKNLVLNWDYVQSSDYL